MEEDIKSVRVKESTWETLQFLRIKRKHKTMENLIIELLDHLPTETHTK